VPKFIPGIKVALFHSVATGKINRKGRLNHFEISDWFERYCIRLTLKFGALKVLGTGLATLEAMFKLMVDSPLPDDS